MADINLVVKISEEDLKSVGDTIFTISEMYETTQGRVYRAIVNGTPLPKGHGDLKDMDDIYEVLEGWNDDTGWIVDAIDNQAQTIIEADKEQ